MKRRDFTRSFGKSYDGPRLRNPLFAVREISKPTKYAVLTCGVVLLLGIPALFVYAPFMRYSDIRVQGLTTIAVSDVTTAVHSVTDKRKWFVLPGAHIILLKTDAIVDVLDTQFHFATLSLHREGRTLVVEARANALQRLRGLWPGKHISSTSPALLHARQLQKQSQ